MVEPTERGDWIKQNTLGTGGFGTVVLWKNKVNGISLAVKKCRWGNDPMLTDKHKERWKLEVVIMNKLQHPNIVRAVDVPDELNVLPNEMPVLAMEYCLKGDLRKVLNLPENCCGLPEATVRNVVRDISSAVEYLHSMRIIHRDLKPENVVLQDVNGKTTYKLIDLGYAKELDQGSLCTSFVGTLQYLAPELFMSQEYTCTVDYWSLGLVTHECAVGLRPFLPNLPPAEWMKYVCKKRPTDICVFMAEDKTPYFSEHLFSENHLSVPFVRDLENWLRVMLEWNPQKRGIEISSDTKQIIAFSKLNEILQKQVIHFFFVPTGEKFSYEVKSDELTEEVVQMLLRDTNTEMKDIECLDMRGHPIVMNKTATTYCATPEDDGEWLICVFHSNHLDLSYMARRTIPSVDRILSDRNGLYIYEEQRKLWAHSVYFLNLEVILQRRLLQAYKVLCSRMVYCNSQMMRSMNKITLEMNKLKSKLELFKKCLHADKADYEEAKKLGITSQKMERYLASSVIEEKIEDIQRRVINCEAASTRVNSKTVGLQQTFHTQNQTSSIMDNIYQRALDIYLQLRQKTKEQRRIACDNSPMLLMLIECLKKRDGLLRTSLTSLQRLQDCKKEISETVAQFEGITQSMDQLSDGLTNAQIDRQKIVWSALRKTVSSSAERQNKSKTDTQSIKTTNSFDSSSPESLKISTQGFPCRSMTDTSSLNHASLSGIINKSSEESMITIRQNQTIRSKLYEQLESWCIEEGEELDFSYLDKMKDCKK